MKMSDDVISSEPMVRFNSNGVFQSTVDEVIREYRLLVHLDGAPLVKVVLSPSRIQEFVTGFLVNECFIDSYDEIKSLEISGNSVFVSRHRPSPIPGINAAEIESSGAVRIARSTGTEKSRPPLVPEPLVAADVIVRCMKYLDGMPVHRRTGGTHCAVLFTAEGEFIFGCEDIGRHNAVDKTVGGAIREGADIERSWMAVAGRLPADMVRKPAAAGIPLIASRAAATVDGIRTGNRTGVTVIGHCKNGSFNCYCHPERIKEYTAIR